MSNELTTRHRSVMPAWQALYYEDPIELVSGEGRYVVDRRGRRYLDFFGGILTTSVGHAVPEVVGAIREQAAKIAHASTLYLAEPMVRLAERIASLSTIPDARVFFTTSGTEANDAALLMATSLRQSNQVLAFRHSYHGRSFTAMAITGNRSWSASSLSGLAVSYVQSGYRLRSPFAKLPDDEYIAACARDLRDVIDTTTSGDVACMIFEPIQGVGGFATPPDGFFAAMKEVLDRYGILMVSDEVQTGWGRTGEHFWGFQAHGIVPDVITFAKGIANGLPLGGVIARADVMNSIHANSISTFGGNPVAVAAADATLSYILDHDLQANAFARGEYLRSRLAPVVARSPWIAELRGKGLMLALETVVPGSIDPDSAAVAALHEACKRRGLLIGKGGLYGNVLRIAPPLSVTQHEVEEAADILLAAIDEVAAARMRVGVFVSETWGAPSTVAQVQARAADAEQLGFASAWTPYLPWSVDALAAIQAAASVTQRIELGTAVVPTYLFHPLALARAAATVHDAAGGRLTLGIGPSQPTVIETMHGIPFTKPAHHTREYLEILRSAMSGAARVEHDGELYHVASMFGVPSEHDKADMPILVGALGALMLRVAGELADGTIATSCDEGAIERVIVPGVTAAAAAAGRPAPRVGTVLAVCVTGAAGLDAARGQMTAHFSTYERIPRYARMLSLGNKERMGDVHLVGDEATVRARLRGFRDAGLTDLLAAPFVPQPATDAEAARRPTLELLADIAARGF